MQITIDLGQAVSLIHSIFGLMELGLIMTAAGYIGYQTSCWLSQFTRMDEPDPTEWVRLWRRIFDRLFLPFGKRAVSRHRPAKWNQMLFQLGISGAVMLGAMGAYTLYSGTVIGAMLVSYYSMGSAPDLSHLIQPGAAFILLLAIAVILYSSDRAVEQYERAPN